MYHKVESKYFAVHNVVKGERKNIYIYIIYRNTSNGRSGRGGTGLTWGECFPPSFSNILLIYDLIGLYFGVEDTLSVWYEFKGVV